MATNNFEKKPPIQNNSYLVLKIDGMRGERCVKSLENELIKLDGVKNISVKAGEARIDFLDSTYATDISAEAAKSAAYGLGFSVTSTELGVLVVTP